MVAHIDGNESNGAQENLSPTCRSCNARIAHLMKRHGLGRRSRQYKPARRGSADSRPMAEWLAAVMSMRGLMTHGAEVRNIVSPMHASSSTPLFVLLSALSPVHSK